VFGGLLPLVPLTIARKIAEEITTKDPSSNALYGFIVLWFIFNWWLGLWLWRCAAKSKRAYKILARVLALFIFASLYSVIRAMMVGTS
jgi:hypothetical protein